MKRLSLISICLLLFASVSAQISGTVKDKKTGKMLEDVAVFINNSSWKTNTDKSGAFTLSEIYPGYFDLVLYKKGFEIFRSPIRIQDGKLYKLNLELIADEKRSSAKAKRDEQWGINYQWFLGGLLGRSEFSQNCSVENNTSLQFELVDNKLQASASEPIILKNAALGFTLHIFLQQMEADNATAQIQGVTYYDLASSNDYNQQTIWERNRLKAFWGSYRHLLKSIVVGNYENEGYSLLDENGASLNLKNFVSPGNIPGYYKISLPNPVRVKFEIEGNATKVEPAYAQQSEIAFEEGFEVNEFGIPFNMRAFHIKGAMEKNGFAASLPINYQPVASIENEKMDWKNFSLLREKIYLQTDRDYYYPRETIWFKAYFGYSMPILRDTISGVVYVDLLSPNKERLDTRTYRVRGGVSWGEFRLDESLPAGEYYLRAYTNWMRNYGDSALFVRQVPVLSPKTNVEVSIQSFISEQASNLLVNTNQESYKGRSKVTLSVELKDDNGQPVKGNLSVSVTDAVASVQLPLTRIDKPGILKISDLGVDNKYFDEIKYFMERGLSFRGVVKDSKGLATSAKLDIIQGNMDNLISMETDEQGEFLVTGLHFTDSIIFAFKPVNTKGKPLPRVDLLTKELPELNFVLPPLAFKLRSDNAIQRIQNVYDPGKDAILLSEVEVKSTKLATNASNEPVRIYGTPDYVVKGDNIRNTVAGTNFLVGLQGKVPGLQVIESMDGGGLPIISVRVRGGTSSLAGNTEPLILVDGVPFPNAQSISALDPNMVDRVEVITRASPQFGSRGTNGVIAIYTKQGAYATNSERDYLSFKVPGYNKPSSFYAPDYSSEKAEHSNPDFRTTIFWKPDLKTDNNGKATADFYTADLATKYRIVVEGITERGKPVRSVTYITVE